MNAKALALLAGGLVAAGGVGTAIGDLGSDDSERGRSFTDLELRKDDGSDDIELVDDEDDRGDGNRGDDDPTRDRSAQSNGPTQDPKTGSGDNTGGTGNTAGTGWTGDTDGDWTDGNDGTGGGDNTVAAPAADSYVAPAPAPAHHVYGDDGGSYSGGGSDG
jgi:hypothetical protein